MYLTCHFVYNAPKTFFPKIIMMRYEDKFQFLEPFQIIEIRKTQEDEEREKREQENRDREERKNEPRRLWLAKYEIEVPVEVKLPTGEIYKILIHVMINMRLRGYYNAPKFIIGKGFLSKDEDGWHCEVFVDKSCQNENFYADDPNYGFITNANYFSDKTLDRVDFDIKECLDLYESRRGTSLWILDVSN